MAYDFVTAVSNVLKRVQIVAGDATLSSLTDSSKQNAIDIAVQMWNEVIDEIYSTTNTPKPKQLAEDTITLATNTRNYTLASDLVRLYYPLRNTTDGLYLTEYPGGYFQMMNDQVNGTYSGQPYNAAIRETDGALYVDYTPTATENGQVYTYDYDKDLVMSLAADTFPFEDVVVRALIPAVAQLWSRERKNKFDQNIFDASIGRGCRYLTKVPPRDSYRPRRAVENITDPMQA